MLFFWGGGLGQALSSQHRVSGGSWSVEVITMIFAMKMQNPPLGSACAAPERISSVYDLATIQSRLLRGDRTWDLNTFLRQECHLHEPRQPRDVGGILTVVRWRECFLPWSSLCLVEYEFNSSSVTQAKREAAQLGGIPHALTESMCRQARYGPEPTNSFVK